MKYLVILCLLAVTLQCTSSCRYRVCYYLNWAQYRPGPSSFMPEYIQPLMCTHVMYAYALVRNNKIVPSEGNDQDSQSVTGMYNRIVALKRRDPNLKVLLTVGGYHYGGKQFSDMVANVTGRRVFIDHAIAYLRGNDFDGLDLAWEYPTKRGGAPSDKQRYTVLLKELSEAFRDEARQSMMPRLLLTAVLAAGKRTIDEAYEVNKIHGYLDFGTINAFNYHGGFDSRADHNSPLYSMTGDPNDDLTVNFTVNYYLQLGFPKDKMVLGLALYGRNSYLVYPEDMNINIINAPIVGDGPEGAYTKQKGFFAYYEYCMEIKINLIGRRGGNPYAVIGGPINKYFLAYEDQKSVEDKVKLVQDKQLLGIMFWSLDYDDFNGKFCQEGKYPLAFAAIRQCKSTKRTPMHTEEKLLHKPVATELDTEVPEELIHPPVTGSVIECPADGIRDHPTDCHNFIICADGFAYVQPCPFGFVYNKTQRACDFPQEKCVSRQ